MPNDKTILVTPEMLAGLADLKKSIAGLSDAEARKKAQAALKILSDALAGPAETLKKKSSCLAHTPML